MRGAILAIAELHKSETDPGAKWHVIEFYSRRQRRVTRSTFAAELHGLADSLEIGKVIAMAYTETQIPGLTPLQLSRKEETGELAIPIHAVIDAKSDFDALSVTDIKAPTEASLIMILLSVKESLLTHSLKYMWWVDTTDMVSDGLTKGAVPRTALVESGNLGRWLVSKPSVSFSERTHRPTVSINPTWRQEVLTVLKTKPE